MPCDIENDSRKKQHRYHPQKMLTLLQPIDDAHRLVAPHLFGIFMKQKNSTVKKRGLR